MHYKNINIKLILFLGLIIFSSIILSGSTSATATNNNSTIYVSTQGNDTWNGFSATYNNTSGYGPKHAINNATKTVADNGIIYIANGTYNESNITITSNMTIIGESQTGTIINANRQNDIFNITSGVRLTLVNLTLENGDAYNGGAINNQGALIIRDCTLQNNTASNYGGAINNDGSSGNATATVNNSTFSNNHATDGGAIINNGDNGTAKATISDDTFFNNSAIYVGGAIFNSGDLGYAISTINNNKFLDNHAKGYYGSGGAIDNAGDYGNSTATINNNTFSSNSATHVGGAIEDTGFYGNNTETTINNNTFTDNTAIDGGAIINDGDHGNDLATTVNNNTFTDNTAINGGAISDAGDYGNVTATVSNNTLLNNTATDGGGVDNSGDYGNITATLNDNTLLNNTASEGGAIINDGDHGTQVTATITNNILLKNTATYYGGAIDNTGDYSDAIVTITNCTIENNTAAEGGAIENDGNYGNTTAIINNCTMKNNIATHYGGAIDDEGDYGNITTTITNNNLLDNTANDGGAINNAGDYGNTVATVNDNTLLNNTVTDNGGAFQNTNGDGNASATLNYNRIVNNTGTDVYSLNGSVSADNNWWGTNFNNTNPESAGITNIPINTWIILNITTNQSTVNINGNTKITANLLYNNNGTLIIGYMPNGVTIKYTATLGKVNPSSATIQDNKSTTVFTAGNTPDIAIVNATVDDQTVITNIKINQIAPIASFTANTTQGITPLTVKFTDTSSNNPTSWLWIFGDGTNSTKQNITHTYNTPETYTVTLRSSNSAGNSTTKPTTLIIYPKLTVTNITPVNGTVDVANNTNITVTFNEPIKIGSSWITLTSSNGTKIPYTTSISGKKLTITPTKTLTNNTKYTLTLHTGSITDLAGNPLALCISNFSTGGDPKILSINPASNGVNVILIFTEPIETGNNWIVLTNNKGITIPFKTEISGDVLILTPKTNLLMELII